MNLTHLMQRIRLGEDSTLELKQIHIKDAGKNLEPHPDGLSDELAAMGNANGGLIDNREGEALPTIAGVLLCTLDPTKWLRNAEILAVAHSGLRNNPNEQLDAQEIREPLDKQILDAFHFVRRNIITAARKPLGRVDYPQYHLGAVFEAIVNAVAHRDYSLHAQRIRLFIINHHNPLPLFG